METPSEEGFYLIGSWIPTIGELSYIDETNFIKGTVNLVNNKEFTFIFNQKVGNEIETIEIKSVNMGCTIAKISDIKIDLDGFWNGRMELKLTTLNPENNPIFALTLKQLNGIIISKYHEHIFHKTQSNIEIYIKRINKTTFFNKTSFPIDFKEEVINKIQKQFRKKFELYKNLFLGLEAKIQTGEILDKGTQILIKQAKGEVLFFDSFLKLFKSLIHEEKIILADEFNKLVMQYMNIFTDDINISKADIIADKSIELARTSIGIGVVGVAISLILGIISLLIA